jgi:Flp pilus assembly protein TadG
MMSSPSRGSISALVVCLVMGFVSLAGLAFDGGRVIDTYVQVSDVAQNAARLGAQQLVGIRNNRPRIDAEASQRLMQTFVSSHGMNASYAIEGTTAQVTIERRVSMRILGLFGIGYRTVRVTRVADIVDG